MTPEEQKFIIYWEEKRKTWRWTLHAKKIFVQYALPFSIFLDLANYYIVGDTAYDFFSFGHIWQFLWSTFLISSLIILASGIAQWNFNESKYWHIKRKYFNKLQ